MNTRRKPLNQTLGFYIPSFFSIHCETNENSDLIFENELDFSVLTHEYIHFLQDCSTSFGLLNLSNYYNCIRHIVHQVYDSDASVVKLPLGITSDIIIDGVNATFITNPENNDYDKSELETFNLYLNKEKAKIINGTKIDIYTIKDHNDKFTYQLGARDILESMAYIIERSLFTDINPAPMIPYRTANILVHSILPELTDEQIIAALCEISLTMFNPVAYFIDILRKIKANKIELTFEKIIEYAFLGLNFSISEHQNLVSYEQAVDYTFEVGLSHIKEFIRAPQYEDLLIWICSVLEKCKALRTSNRVFIVDLLMSKQGRDNLIALMTTKVGIPSVINGSGEAFSFDQKSFSDKLLLFPAMEQVCSHLLYSDITECDLYPVCKRAQKDSLITYTANEICLNKPWEKCKSEKLCPFANIWFAWGLAKKDYEKET